MWICFYLKKRRIYLISGYSFFWINFDTLNLHTSPITLFVMLDCILNQLNCNFFDSEILFSRWLLFNLCVYFKQTTQNIECFHPFKSNVEKIEEFYVEITLIHQIWLRISEVHSGLTVANEVRSRFFFILNKILPQRYRTISTWNSILYTNTYKNRVFFFIICICYNAWNIPWYLFATMMMAC